MIHNLWSTPIEHGKFEVPELANFILQTYNMADPPSTMDNYNILDNKAQPIQELRKVALENFKKYSNRCFGVDIDRYSVVELKGWVTGHGEQYQMPLHNHAGAYFSAVYYALAEEQDQGGQIHFMDPRSNANRGYDLNYQHPFKPFSLTPETGDFVIFPSFVYHHVSQFFSRFRIAIPIDLYLYEE